MTVAGSVSAPWTPWNIDLFVHMHATTASPHLLVAAAVVLAQWPLYAALGMAAWQFWRHRDGTGAALVVGAWLVANRIEAAMAALAFHARPFAAGFGPAFMAHAADNSMPSSHVATGSILVIVLALRGRRRASALAAALTLAMAWARIYVGVHWPADMAGALLVATISVAAAWAVGRTAMTWRRHGRRRAAHLHTPTIP